MLAQFGIFAEEMQQQIANNNNQAQYLEYHERSHVKNSSWVMKKKIFPRDSQYLLNVQQCHTFFPGQKINPSISYE